MNIQDYLQNAMVAMRAQSMKTSPQLTLGELISKLEAIADKSKPVVFNDVYCPTGLGSWRGDYAELALTYETGEGKLSVSIFLEMLKGYVGATVYGYKGGEFLMGKTTPVWVANYGESHGFQEEGDIDTQAVVDVSQNERHVIIETKNIDY